MRQSLLQHDKYSIYDQVALKWISDKVGISPQYFAPYEELILPADPTLKDQMWREPIHPIEDMMCIEYYPQTDKGNVPDVTFRVVELIDGFHRLHYHSTRHTTDWLHEVRYRNGHLYMLVDIPERYRTDKPVNETLNFVAQWLMPSISLFRENARFVDVIPGSYLLWNHNTNLWSWWEQTQVCHDIYKERANLAAIDSIEGRRERARRREQARKERLKNQQLLDKKLEQERALYVKQIREAMQKYHSAEELKAACAIRTLSSLQSYGTLLADINARYRLDSLTVPQLKDEPIENLEELCSHYSNPHDMYRYHPRIFNYLTRTQDIFRIYPDYHILKREAKKRMRPITLAPAAKMNRITNKYTIRDIWDGVAMCSSYREFREKYEDTLYNSAKHRCLLGDIRHAFAVEVQNTDEGMRARIRYEAKKYDSWPDMKKHGDANLVDQIQRDPKLKKYTTSYFDKRRHLKDKNK